MQFNNWYEGLKEAVQQARPFVQAEQQKRLTRYQMGTANEDEKQALTLADYIEAFQVYTNGIPFDGEDLFLSDFLQKWTVYIEQLQAGDISKETNLALDIMQEDVEEIVQALQRLDAADEGFENRVKKQLAEFIEVVIVAIRDGWSSNPQLYEGLLQLANEFLAEMGVSTVNIAVGNKMNYDYVEPIASKDNVTADEEQVDCISEIHLYPYVFGNDALPFVAGRAIAWRKG